MRRLRLLEVCSDPLEEMLAAREREPAAAMLERKLVLIQKIDEVLRASPKGILGNALAMENQSGKSG
jgi:hypothetical protein